LPAFNPDFFLVAFLMAGAAFLLFLGRDLPKVPIQILPRLLF
jgi:hypothetical protein